MSLMFDFMESPQIWREKLLLNLKYKLWITRRVVITMMCKQKNSKDLDSSAPLAIFGVLTDVQYADVDNRPAGYDPTKTRYYRQALDHVDSAFNYWQKMTHPVKFVLQCGDIIDGLNRESCGSLTALQKTLDRFEQHKNIPTFHTVGNHELYNFSRLELVKHFAKTVKKMKIPPSMFNSERRPLSETDNLPLNDLTLYYKFCPVAGMKCISLDCFDISVIGYDKLHPNYMKAAQILYDHHGHHDFDGWDCDGLLQGLERRFQQMNGALSKQQLQWLDEELLESDRLGEKVIVFGHVSLAPDSSDWSCLLWNYNDVIDIFHRHNCVIAYFSGHTHNSGYAMDSKGIHYVVLNGIVETSPSDKAFATISLYDDRLEINGHGREESRTLWINTSCDGIGSAEDDIESISVVQSSKPIKVEV
ncbi:manganese-dependent ADP-ribose/CDP-alcohol diphosphatase-like [Centruroides sculpturatus]|uniref:manganese-dependent ADP-ribose/CDP-alcohol diphosphatase-like n=1 Tax=Centruroides sculpturatus TaxID=218467 RepID=UPI000C6EC0B6|nr:manganese-dependent ADP-ribose/CDP-alcohol diphosphatase-like [Centruroides sculpturatus]XP_023237059.1 manganese-dependent ADP-ribose/CDP-alcohol diphosphatase-like [Centruroides sculpturatus]XP_023237060.1 manganese-dependent ADP-ribose/CDP-alcohol diphosphatase-like [Centruroides sculpturatus]